MSFHVAKTKELRNCKLRSPHLPTLEPAMAGNKHPRSDDEAAIPLPIVLPFMAMFETFRGELDEHHDRRERIIKASRDITALSKKM